MHRGALTPSCNACEPPLVRSRGVAVGAQPVVVLQPPAPPPAAEQSAQSDTEFERCAARLDFRAATLQRQRPRSSRVPRPTTLRVASMLQSLRRVRRRILEQAQDPASSSGVDALDQQDHSATAQARPRKQRRNALRRCSRRARAAPQAAPVHAELEACAARFTARGAARESVLLALAMLGEGATDERARAPRLAEARAALGQGGLRERGCARAPTQVLGFCASLEQLRGMGFSTEQACGALALTDNSLEAAIALLAP